MYRLKETNILNILQENTVNYIIILFSATNKEKFGLQRNECYVNLHSFLRGNNSGQQMKLNYYIQLRKERNYANKRTDKDMQI